MTTWKRDCLSHRCPHAGARLPAIPHSHGLLARALCARPLIVACKHRRNSELPAIAAIWNCPVVAGYKLEVLTSRTQVIDILHQIHANEMWMIHKWAADYTDRGIAWAVIRRGQTYSLIKELTS